MSFSFSDLHPSLQRGLADLGFSDPTPIQRDAIPPGLQGRDMLACAMTGSGKTAAFLLPVMQQLLDRPKGRGTSTLILTPTRELAAQIVELFQGLARHTHLKAAAVYGGVGMGPQERAFQKGVDCIVACPGRLLDHFQYPYAHMRDLDFLILDEADRMLDMGFLPDIRRVLKHVPQAEQTLLFSATMPAPIVALSRQLLENPVRINVERKSAPATRIEQSVFPVQQNLKATLLAELIHRDEIGNALVFTRTKHRANRLVEFLSKRNVSCDRIHGNRSQAQRTRAMADFKSGKSRILVATDIAARGIDVEDLSHVVNFDVPNMPEDYIHRVGRTARASASGEAFTFVAPQEQRDLRSIERAVGRELPRRRLEGFDPNRQKGEELEIPIGKRIAAIRARKAEDRARSRAKGNKKGNSNGRGGGRGGQQSRGGSPRGGSASGRPSQGRPNGNRSSYSRDDDARGNTAQGNVSRDASVAEKSSSPRPPRPRTGGAGRPHGSSSRRSGRGGFRR